MTATDGRTIADAIIEAADLLQSSVAVTFTGTDIHGSSVYHTTIPHGLAMVAEAIDGLTKAYADRTQFLFEEARDAAARRNSGDA